MCALVVLGCQEGPKQLREYKVRFWKHWRRKLAYYLKWIWQAYSSQKVMPPGKVLLFAFKP